MSKFVVHMAYDVTGEYGLRALVLRMEEEGYEVHAMTATNHDNRRWDNYTVIFKKVSTDSNENAEG